MSRVVEISLHLRILVLFGNTINKGDILGTVGNISISESALENYLNFKTIQLESI